MQRFFEIVRAVLVLGRVSNLPTVWTNCLAGWVLAGYLLESPDLFAMNFPRFLALAGGCSLLYVGGMALNDACDAKWDRDHAPDRPIPSGALSAGAVWAISAFWLAGGTSILIAAEPQSWPGVGCLLAMIVLYDLVHKRTAGAVALMGACRFLVYGIAGYFALGAGDWSAVPDRVWIAAGGLFLYIVGVTAAARGESTGGRVPLWAWVLLAAPLIAWGAAGTTLFGAIFALLFAAWLGFAMRALRGDNPARVGKFVGVLLAGIVLVDALMASMADMKTAFVCLAFLPLTLLLQRYVPAT